MQITNQEQLAGWKPGLAMAGIAAIASVQPSLLPRGPKQQAAVTAAAIGLGYGAGVLTNALAERVDAATGLGAVGSRAAVAGGGALAALGTTLALRGRPSAALETLRTAAGVLAGSAVVGAALIGEQALVDAITGDSPSTAATAAAHAAILGAAAVGIGALVLGRPRASAVTADAHAAWRSTVSDGRGAASAFDTSRFDEISAMRDRMTTISGRDAATHLPDTLVGKHGLRFLNESTPAAEIARVMGADASSVRDPIRIYGGMRNAASHDELAQLIFDEALAKGAFDRSHVVLYVPSGTGQVNPMPVAATEYATLGDVASIGLQYNDKPSVLSVHKVDEGAKLFRAVTEKVNAHLSALPAEARPTVTAYGESLGAWAVQDAFLTTGVEGIAAAGVDNVINVGTPQFSKLRAETIGRAGQALDPSGTMFEFADVDALRALDPQQRAGVRAYLLTQHNDPVSKFSPHLFVGRPEWLSSVEHGTGVPRRMKWSPGVSGVHGVVDTINGTSPTPGILGNFGHDYRAAMAPVMAEVLDTGTSAEQLDRIAGALSQLELARAHAPLPTPRFAG